MSPDSAKAGGAAFTLKINGTNFVSGATAKWNGAALKTTFVSAIKLKVAVPAGDIATSAMVAGITNHVWGIAGLLS